LVSGTYNDHMCFISGGEADWSTNPGGILVLPYNGVIYGVTFNANNGTSMREGVGWCVALAVP